MNAFLAKLNLRPQEQRFLAVIAIVIFIALNVWLVWPLFDDWMIVRNRTFAARDMLRQYQSEVEKLPLYQARLKQLENVGMDVVSEEQALQLQRIIQNQATANGVFLTSIEPRSKTAGVSTNQFFDEHALVVRTSTGNKELVNFLVSLASSESMIRVRELSIQPDSSGTKLQSSITFVASYQKKPAATKPAAVAARRKT